MTSREILKIVIAESESMIKKNCCRTSLHKSKMKKSGQQIFVYTQPAL